MCVQVLPLLIESLQCSSNEDLIAATLEGVCALVMDTPTSICSYVPSLIPKLLQLAKMGKIMVSLEEEHLIQAACRTWNAPTPPLCSPA